MEIMEMRKKICEIMVLVSVLLLCSLPVMAAVATFDDLVLSSESYWNGSDGTSGFTSGGADFSNNYTDWGGGAYSWDGFAYSNMTDTTTCDYSNQYSAYTGGGYGHSANYGISYVPAAGYGSPPVISFPSPVSVSGVYLTNTAYTALSMLNGDGFAKKFGGDDGNDPDWFKLSIWGITEAGTLTSPIDFYLADFRFPDNSRDYVLDEWTWVDLSDLGEIVGIQFSLSSSDNGDYGMNTPAYFAMDDLTYTLLSATEVYACPQDPAEAVTYKPGDTLLSPLNTVLTVPPSYIYVHPVITVDEIDVGKRAEIILYAWLPQYSSGLVLYQNSSVLGDMVDFSHLLSDAFDLTHSDGLIFDIYYGYILDDGTVKYNDYRVSIDGESEAVE